MAPVVLAFKSRPKEFQTRVVVTAQHRALLDRVLSFFDLRPDVDLDIMREGQSLTDVSVRALERLAPVFQKERPDLVLVHGDTLSTLMGALAAFYQKIPVAHVEAGLRSGDDANPFPEEVIRRLTDSLSVQHFAPTAESRSNLLKEGVSRDRIFVTGNTAIDALQWGLARLRQRPPVLPRGLAEVVARPFVLITAHRRENFGKPLENIGRAILQTARKHQGISFVFPVHPNPHVRRPVHHLLGDQKNIFLIDPLDYAPLLYLLERTLFVLTDSGGLQEEAPSLGKPVLVLRRVTERPEAVRAGTVRLVGTDTAPVSLWMHRLLGSGPWRERMARAVNPYGDGRAAQRILEAVRFYFGLQRGRPDNFR
jgi:UDP-N-acetylglucosamine 2-epimerase (non-hydrolysing)